ncbi:POK9 protein, partial [Podilymbus podiceps]|nr:POK9 protein [Podilymbus podiceps]
RGSLGLDLAAAIDVTFLDNQVKKILTGIHEPIYNVTSDTGALLLGHSSTGLAGLIGLPGVIDADYRGEIQVVAYVLYPPAERMFDQNKTLCTYTAQLLLYDRHSSVPSSLQKNRGAAGFGSTGQHLVTLVRQMEQRPLITVTLKKGKEQHTLFKVMTDTGADVTILS